LLARWDSETEATHVAFSPDSRTYATALADGTIQLWPASGGKPLRTLCLPDDGAPSVVGLAFLDDGRTLAAASAGGDMLFWRVADGGLLQEINLGEQGILHVAFAPNGQIFAASVENGTVVKLFSREISTPARTIVWNAGGAMSLAFSPDSQTLIASCLDGTIQGVRVSDGRSIFGAGDELPTGQAARLAFSPDGKLLAVGLAGGFVQVRSGDGKLLRVLSTQGKDAPPNDPAPDAKEIAEPALPAHPAFSPDGKLLAAAQADGTVQLWLADDGTLLRTLDGGPAKGRTSLALSPDGRRLVAAWEAGTIELWGLPAKLNS
jgi:WD40 repeat protein